MLLYFIDKLTQLIPVFANAHNARNQQMDLALKAISDALIETKLYLKKAKTLADRDLAKEANIAKLWAAAAIPVRHFDSGLAETCMYKSEFWISPEDWSQNRIQEYQIGINTVSKSYKELLNSDD